MEENINSAIKQALEDAPESKFVQSIDIAFTIKDVDLKNPTNRIKEEIRLPSGRGREVKIAMFAAGEAATRAREAGITVFTPPEIEELGGNKDEQRKLQTNSTSSFPKSLTWDSLDATLVPFLGHEVKCLGLYRQRLTLVPLLLDCKPPLLSSLVIR